MRLQVVNSEQVTSQAHLQPNTKLNTHVGYSSQEYKPSTRKFQQPLISIQKSHKESTIPWEVCDHRHTSK